MSTRGAAHRAAAHRAFTLVELVVSIGVILLLAGLTLSVSVAVIEQSERRQTAQALELLEQAVREWELVAERKLRWWNPSDDPAYREQADIHGDTPEVLIITEMLQVIRRVPRVRQILAQIDPELVHVYREGETAPWLEGDAASDVKAFIGEIAVLDAWGKPIYATHPGRPHDPEVYPYDSSEAADPDGTIRTYNEREYGIAPNRQVVFVSAGPDGRFGLPEEFDLQGPALQEAKAEAREDNIFSAAVRFE